MKSSYFSNFLSIKSIQRGFTLVELMVAMTVGLFISAGVISLFIGTKQSYRTNEGIARLQENGRFAIDYLSRDVRQAGFPQFIGSMIIRPDDQGLETIQGWDGAGSAPSGASLPANPPYTANTDIFSISYYDTEITTPAFVTHTYYIATESGTPGLRQIIDSGSPEILVDGVYDMQVLYGFDDDDDGQLDRYDIAVTSGMDQVVAIRINLLLGSGENNLIDAPMSVPSFLTNDENPFAAATGDRRIYQMFSTTIALRNRLR